MLIHSIILHEPVLYNCHIIALLIRVREAWSGKACTLQQCRVDNICWPWLF